MDFRFSPEQLAFLDDLESGRYKQFHGALYARLRDEDKFCFMGVATEGMRLRDALPGLTIIRRHDDFEDGFAVVQLGDDGENCMFVNKFPPREVWETLGFFDNEGTYDYSEYVSEAAGPEPSLDASDEEWDEYYERGDKVVRDFRSAGRGSCIADNDAGVAFEALASLIRKYPRAFWKELA